MLARLRARLRDQRGVGVLEVVLTLTLTVVSVGVTLSLLATSDASHRRTIERAETVAQVQEGVHRLVRELHQAASFNFLSSQVIDIDAWAGTGHGAAALRRVRYDCSQARECRRYASAVGSTTLSTTYTVLAGGVRNADVFTPQPDFVAPRAVAVKLELTVGDESRHPATISNATSLPNIR